MSVLRQVIAFGVACFAGVPIPVLAIFYDSACRYHGSLLEAWHDLDWRHHFIAQAIFVAEGSTAVGLFAGGFGVLVLRLRHYSRFRDYAIAGAIIGGLCGVLFETIFYHSGDPAISWAVFATLPAISMAAGFACYWLIGVRSYAAS